MIWLRIDAFTSRWISCNRVNECMYIFRREKKVCAHLARHDDAARFVTHFHHDAAVTEAQLADLLQLVAVQLANLEIPHMSVNLKKMKIENMADIVRGIRIDRTFCFCMNHSSMRFFCESVSDSWLSVCSMLHGVPDDGVDGAGSPGTAGGIFTASDAGLQHSKM